MADEWYRRKTWGPEGRQEFFARLRRSRSLFHKSQYLRVQAIELQETGTAEGIAAALELIAILIQEYPDLSQLAAAYLVEGECREQSGDTDGAIEAYRQSIRAQRDYPNFRVNAHRSFAWLVATKPLPALYQEALNALDEMNETTPFPASRYRSSAARALIHGALGNSDSARKWAKLALEAADLTHSGMRYHPRLGLVENPGTRVRSKLEELAAV
ncbi:MAG: hypothetical protein ACHRXM_29085 [Isosphaerales bacterium]